MLDRRQLLAGTAASAATLPFAALHPAVAQTAMAGRTVPIAAQRFMIGEIAVTALSDGSIRIGPGVLGNIEADDFDQIMRMNYENPETYVSGINAFLVEGRGETVLIDAGTGGSMDVGAGQVLSQLAGIGVAPSDITRLVATHLHPDHVGGAVVGGTASFPNAALVVNDAERTYWGNDENATSGSPEFFRLAQAVLDTYDNRLEPFSAEGEVAGGLLTAMPLPGHTPGHTGYMISDGDEQLLIWGDIVHVAPVQLADPRVSVAFDVDPDQATETRREILDRVSSDRLRIAGSHIPFPGFGHVASDDDGYRLVPSSYPYPS